MPTDNSLIFITDRTSTDVQTAIDNKSYNVTKKGSLNFQDLNRIENNMFIIINDMLDNLCARFRNSN